MFTRCLLLGVVAFVTAALLSPLSFAQESSAPMADTPLTIERLYASPSLSGPTPQGLKYSPDGQRVTFLKASEDDSTRYDLWQFDVATGEQSLLVDSRLLVADEGELSEEEKALRERKRIAGRKGIVSYDWGTADTILVPLGGDLYLVTLTNDGPQTNRLTATEAFEYDAKVTADGRYASFVRDGAVYAIELVSSTESRLTPLAEPENAISYGVAEFVAQEEMGRYTGYWWSPDSKYVAYTRVNETPVDIIPRFDIAADSVTVINQRYPRAGRPNAVVDLFVRNLETGETIQIDWVNEDWGEMAEEYLARVYWADGKVIIQAVNRDQTVIRTLRGDPETGGLEALWAESQTNWVNLNSDWVPAGDFILTSEERLGARHLVALNASGEQEFRVTSGDGPIDEVKGADTDLNIAYFTGQLDTPLETHLYRNPISPSEFDVTPYAASVRLVPAPPPVRVTEAGKSWNVAVAPDGKSFIGISSAPDQPPQTGLYRMDGSLITWIEENALNADHPYAPYLAQHTVPEYGTLTAEDGKTLHYSIQKPPGFNPTKKYPVLLEVYGGPHVQTVTRNWERLSDQYYSREGYIVFRLDNRGTSGRGKAFEDVIYRQMGIPEVRDQLVGIEWLKAQAFVDANRIGIQGWSYGGYMTLMTILQAPEGTFAAAVSGAPVTDWSLYDTFYTERYMDTPEDNPDGYAAGSVFAYTDNLTTPLLLVHGMADDNVTFDNTTRLMADLQEKGKSFEVMTYPGQRHGIRGEALQVHLMKTRMAFLNRHLKPGE